MIERTFQSVFLDLYYFFLFIGLAQDKQGPESPVLETTNGMSFSRNWNWWAFQFEWLLSENLET
jgi:hypothetical protein